MKAYTYSEARQRLATVLDLARREGRVQIRRQDGSVFMVQSISSEGSPLDVPGVGTTLRPGELTRLLREQRRASGERLMTALSNRRLQPTQARRARRAAGTRKK